LDKDKYFIGENSKHYYDLLSVIGRLQDDLEEYRRVSDIAGQTSQQMGEQVSDGATKAAESVDSLGSSIEHIVDLVVLLRNHGVKALVEQIESMDFEQLTGLTKDLKMKRGIPKEDTPKNR